MTGRKKIDYYCECGVILTTPQTKKKHRDLGHAVICAVPRMREPKKGYNKWLPVAERLLVCPTCGREFLNSSKVFYFGSQFEDMFFCREKCIREYIENGTPDVMLNDVVVRNYGGHILICDKISRFNGY